MDVCVNPLVCEARAAIVNNLDSTLVWLFEQYILRFQIAVHDIVVFLEFESLQHLNGEPSDKVLANPVEVVAFNELVQIHAETFECNQ